MKLFQDEHVYKRLNLSDGDSFILLNTLDYSKFFPLEQHLRNIFRVKSSGGIIWQVAAYWSLEYDPVQKGDREMTFVDLYWDDNRELHGYTWTGMDYVINPDTGAIESAKFVK